MLPAAIIKNIFPWLLLAAFISCKPEATVQSGEQYPAIKRVFAGKLNPQALPDYGGQEIPDYIFRFNDSKLLLSNTAATLGRVLFYDKKLSVNNQISCASCHQQEFAFSDTARQSVGVNGLTGRHSMRLINARFGDEDHFFWDERAPSLEHQTTQPIQDHKEMGFSGMDGAPDLDSLIDKLAAEDYYQELFTLAFGDSTITEERLQWALGQFVRSLYSFDSRYDEGRSAGHIDGNHFPNFSALENEGKRLFVFPVGAGGAGCAACHLPPEFSIAYGSGNNGVTGIAGDPNGKDYSITRAPTLRDLLGPSGTPNGPFMHDGSFSELKDVLAHYADVPQDPMNNRLDQRLRKDPNSTNSRILTASEQEAIIAFLKTLTGDNIYSDEKFSNPFPE